MSETRGSTKRRLEPALWAAPRAEVRHAALPRGWVAPAAALLTAVLVGFLPRYYLHLVILSLIYGFLAASIDLLMGPAGLTSFGHAAFFGGAAYTVGVLTTRMAAPFPVATAAGLATAILMAATFGLLVSHLRGDQFLLATLALGMVVWGGAYRWVSMTGGDNGVPGIPRPSLAGISFAEPRAMYYLALALFILALLAVAALKRSPLGYSLLGVRENEARLRSLGYNVWLHKYLGFVISGFIAGVGGVLYAYYNGFVSPVDVHITTSVQGVLMVILGGTGTPLGPLVGSVVVVVIRDLLSAYTERWMTVLGVLYVVVMLYVPAGLSGLVGRGRRADRRA